MIDISIIVPVYNVERYLNRCLDSILAQNFEHFEVILVDDGSRDRSGEICDQYEKKDKRVKVLHQENHGQSAARNRGVENAKGKWICFVDSDDVIHPSYLHQLYKAVKEHNVEFSMCDHMAGKDVPNEFYVNKEYKFELMQIDEQLLYDMSQWGKYGLRYGVVWGKLVKKEIIQKFPFTEGRIYEDTPVVCKWLYEAKRIANSFETLYFYMNNPNSTVTSKFSKKKLDKLWCWEEQEKFYKQIKYSKLQTMAKKEYILEGKELISFIRKEKNRFCVSIEIWLKILFKFFINYNCFDIYERHYILNELFPMIRVLYMKIRR